MRPAPDLVPIEELDREILNLCTRINVATCELLMLVRDVVDTETGEVLAGKAHAPAGAFLSAAERSVSEPPRPRYLH